MKIGFAVLNYNIKKENVAGDSSPALRNNLLRKLKDYYPGSTVTVVSPILKNSKSMIPELGIIHDMENDHEFDLMIIESSGTGFINYNTNLERVMRMKDKAKAVIISIHDVRYVIPDSYVNDKFNTTFFSSNLKGIITWGTQYETIRKEKHIPDNVIVQFAPVVKDYVKYQYNQKDILFGFVGDCHDIRRDRIKKFLFDLPEQFRPVICGLKYDEFVGNVNADFWGHQPPEVFFRYKSMFNIQDKYSDKYGWLPSKIAGDSFHKNVVTIFTRETISNFTQNKMLTVHPFVADTRDELVGVLEVISKMSDLDIINYCDEWTKFIDNYCSINYTMKAIDKLYRR